MLRICEYMGWFFHCAQYMFMKAPLLEAVSRDVADMTGTDHTQDDMMLSDVV